MQVLSLGSPVLVPAAEKKPIIVPTGEPPIAGGLAPGAAAANAAAAASSGKAFLGLSLEGAEGMKNILFLGFLGFVVYKYGRGLLK